MPKTSAGVNAAILSGDLRFSAGGVRTDDLIGEIGIDQVVAAIRDGSVVLPNETTGLLPDAGLAANQGRIAVSGNHILQSIDHGATGLVVVFKRYGPTRVVLTGEPARTSQEDNYQGAFNVPPDISAYDASDFLWDRGSQLWLFKQNQNDVTWRGFGGPAGFAHGSLYASEALAETHVSETGKVFIIGQGSGQHVFIVTTYTAATDENWQWDPLGVSLGDVQSAIAAHNTATDAHNDIRVLISALDGVEIEAYSSSATYSRGSANSIVTHSNGLFIYISSTQRSSSHDPDEHPGYWLRLNEGVTYQVISSGSHRISARTLVIDGNTDAVYLCTTTQETARDLAYIAAQADTIGGTFINLTNLIPTTWKGPHIIGQDYEAGDRVTTTANSRIYTARVDTDETPPHADWIQTGPVGSGGGFTLRQGTTAPASSLGDDGDWYLRTSNGQWYEKVSGAWASRYTDMVGEAGSGITQTEADARYLNEASNLSDLANAATARTNLGLGSAAEQPANAFLTADTGDARYLNESSNLSDLPDASTGRTNLGLGTAATRDTGTAQNNVPILDASGDIDAGIVPIDNTLQVDGSGDLGVQISTVIDLLDEDIRYYSTDQTREDAQQASKGVSFLNPSTFAKRIHSVEWDFEAEGVGHNYDCTFFELDDNYDISFVYGRSETHFNLSGAGTHRFNFDGSNGLRIPGTSNRLGLVLSQTGSDSTAVLKVFRGQPASDSPRISYPDAVNDFPFDRSIRFASNRPELGESMTEITNGEIYGYPKIRYTLELEHASLVGDGNITPAHIDSGSSDDGTVLTADGSGGSAFEDLPSVESEIRSLVEDFAETGNSAKVSAEKIPGSLTHRQAQAVTVSGSTLTIPTEDSVQGGDTVLFVIPTPWSVTGNLTVRVTQGGTVQASTTLALNDRVGTRLTGGDVVAEEEMEIILATDWRSLVHPTGSGTGASLSNATPSAHGIGQSGAAGTSTAASRSDHQHAIPAGVPVATGTANDEGTATTASRSDHVHQNGVFSWSFVIDTLIVPELNQDAINTARLVLEDSGLTHYLTFLDWTTASLDTISHLPVGAHIGLRQGATTRILEVQAEWDATNERYQVTNVNTGILTEASSGTATELLLTAGAGGGSGAIEEFDSTRAYAKGAQAWTGTGAAFTVWTANQDISANSTTPTRELPQNWIIESGPGSIRGLLSPINVNALRVGDIFWHEEISDAPKVYFTRTAGNYSNTLGDDPDDFIELTVAANRLIPSGGTDGQVLTKASGTDYDTAWEDAASGGVITGFTQLRAPATLDVAQTWTATGATIPAADGDEWVRMNGNFDGEVPENFEFLSSRLRSLAEHLVGGSTSTGDVERLQFHDGSVFQRVLMAQTAPGELILRHEASTQSLGNLSVYSYSSIAGDGDIIEVPFTDADKNFAFTSAAATGQNRELFDSDITLPTDIGDREVFILRVESDSGENNILLTKAQLDALTAVTPVTWASQTTNGVTADQTGDDKNALLFPLGQNRGLFLGISNETPYRLQWGASAPFTFTLQIIRVVSAGGAGGLPASEASDSTVSPGTVFDETSIDVPTGTWGFVNFGVSGAYRLGEWHRFLVADLTGLTDGLDNGTSSSANALTFLADEESYFYLGKTSGGKVLVGANRGETQPGTVRIRSN